MILIIRTSGRNILFTEKEVPNESPLEALQQTVDGPIEQIHPQSFIEIGGVRFELGEYQVFCNEEGRMKQLPVNFEASLLLGVELVGTVVILTGSNKVK